MCSTASIAAGVGPRGSGLGLAVVAAIISAHDGRYGVESELGKGSVFWIELPAAPTEPDTLGGIKKGTEWPPSS